MFIPMATKYFLFLFCAAREIRTFMTVPSHGSGLALYRQRPPISLDFSMHTAICPYSKAIFNEVKPEAPAPMTSTFIFLKSMNRKGWELNDFFSKKNKNSEETI